MHYITPQSTLFVILMTIGLVACCNDISIDWFACPGNQFLENGEIISSPAFVASSKFSNACKRTTLPSTIFSMKLEQGDFDFKDPFYGLNLMSVPDINTTGVEHYTYWFLGRFNLANSIECSQEQSKVHIIFRGINYRPEFFLNAKQIFDMDTKRDVNLNSGIFRRYDLDISHHIQQNDAVPNSRSEHLLAVLVHPPDFTGSAAKGGQGGDHEIARNGAISQFSAGWDWIQASPDRNTGIWDKISLIRTGDASLVDPVLHTVSIDNISDDGKTAAIARLEGNVLVRNENHRLAQNQGGISGQLLISIATTDGSEIYSNIIFVSNITARSSYLIPLENVELNNCHLWWPHTHGEPYLHRVTLTFHLLDEISGELHPKPSSIVSFQLGIRVVEPFIDESTKGRAFRINNVPVFLVGGNWIATDQFLRFSTGDQTSTDRYHNEVKLHKEMGMNIIRVWGGGLAERPEFYDACDRLGMLVHQEFWMTGDNNGRWGGQFDYPDDSQSYLLNARHTILMLRSHASLLLWCAGNELNPKEMNPNHQIAYPLAAMISELDPYRYYVPSSMSTQSTDPTTFDADFALAPQDGPYNILYPSIWYNIRNPGLAGFDKTPISYQPEVGSVSTPVLASLKRFLPINSTLPESLPSYLSSYVDPVWDYHKYITYTTDGVYDHLYAYSIDFIHNRVNKTPENHVNKNKKYECIRHRESLLNQSRSIVSTTIASEEETASMSMKPITLEEYSIRAQLVQFQQYRALFEGYLMYQWKYYAAMIMWKSQSPWPAFRGALYDYYLDTTGGFWGVREALKFTKDGLHASLNPKTLEVTVINRLPNDVHDINLVVHATDVNGANIGETMLLSLNRLNGNGAHTFETPWIWPFASNDLVSIAMIFVDIESSQILERVTSHATADNGATVYPYWLSNPSNDQQIYSQFGVIYEDRSQRASLQVGLVNSQQHENFVSFSLRVECMSASPTMCLFSRLTLIRESKSKTLSSIQEEEDNRVLPTFFSENYFTLMQNSSIIVSFTIDCAHKAVSDDTYVLMVEGWNIDAFGYPLKSCC